MKTNGLNTFYPTTILLIQKIAQFPFKSIGKAWIKSSMPSHLSCFTTSIIRTNITKIWYQVRHKVHDKFSVKPTQNHLSSNSLPLHKETPDQRHSKLPENILDRFHLRASWFITISWKLSSFRLKFKKQKFTIKPFPAACSTAPRSIKKNCCDAFENDFGKAAVLAIKALKAPVKRTKE